MDVYMLHRNELDIIADALREYRERHCGKDCLHLSGCAAQSSCEKLQDLSCYKAIMGRIEFIEDHPPIFEALKVVQPSQAEPRWLSDFPSSKV